MTKETEHYIFFICMTVIKKWGSSSQINLINIQLELLRRLVCVSIYTYNKTEERKSGINTPGECGVVRLQS